jgi:hypothetical protein
MAIRPILFSGPMVRALLEGHKTMTRRALKPPIENGSFDGTERGEWLWTSGCFYARSEPRFAPGDLLWVRETWKPHSIYEAIPPRHVPQSRIFYAADERYSPNCRWRPGIHMPRWASRITLAVTAVKVERLQDISEADAEAEGASPILVPPDGGSAPHVEGFRALWNSINGPGA